MDTKFLLGITELQSNKTQYQTSNSVKNCPYCHHYLEDEIHFLFFCPLYDSLRQRYLSGSNLDFYSAHKLAILSVSSHASIVDLAKYVFYAFKLRESVLAEQNSHAVSVTL